MNIEEIKLKLALLQEDSKPLFGLMSPQHMVEHLIITFKLSVAKIKIADFEPTEKQLAQKEALLNTPMDFPKGIRAPGLPSTLMPLKYKNLEEAMNQLIQSMEEYEHFFSEKGKSTLHPRFGKMTFEDWNKFHSKHIPHHLSQFNL